MRMIVDETSQFAPTSQIDAVLSRRSFVKSAAVAAILGSTRPEDLMAETKEGTPHRALGRTGETVSAIGLGGYHIGKQADENESIRYGWVDPWRQIFTRFVWATMNRDEPASLWIENDGCA
jgi:hypothetical protein